MLWRHVVTFPTPLLQKWRWPHPKKSGKIAKIPQPVDVRLHPVLYITFRWHVAVQLIFHRYGKETNRKRNKKKIKLSWRVFPFVFIIFYFVWAYLCLLIRELLSRWWQCHYYANRGTKKVLARYKKVLINTLIHTRFTHLLMQVLRKGERKENEKIPGLRLLVNRHAKTHASTPTHCRMRFNGR